MSKRILISILLSIFILTANAQKAKLIIPSGHIYGLADASFSDDDKYIITVAENVKIWEASSGKLIKDINFLTKPSDALLLKNNRVLVVACEDSVRVWDIYNDRQIKALAGNGFQFSEELNSLIIMNLNDNNPTLTKNAKLFDASTYALKFEFEDPIAYISDDNQYITVNFDIVNVYDRSFKKVFTNKEGNIAGVSSDYRYVSIIKDTAIKIWDSKAKKLLHTMTVDALNQYSLKFVPEQNMFIVQTTPQKSSNGYTTQDDDSFIRGFDLTTFKEKYKFPEQNGNIQEIKIHKGIITVASNDSTIRQWEAKTGKLIAQIKDPNGYSAHISSDNTTRFVLASSLDFTAKVWDMQTKKIKVQLEEANSYISKLKFIGQEDLAFFVRGDDAWIWDVKKGQPKLTVPGKKGRYTTQATINKEGTYLYIISKARTKHENTKGGGFTLDFKMRDCKLEIYDINKGVLINQYPLSEEFWRFAPSYNGQTVIISNRDDTYQQLNIISGNKTSPKLNKNLLDVEYYSNDEFVIIADSTFSLYNNQNRVISTFKLKGKISSYKYDQQSGVAVLVLSDQSIVIQDVKANKILYEISNFRKNINKAFDDQFTNIIFDQNRKYVAISGVFEANIIVIDLKTGDMNKSIKIPSYSASISFNINNNLLVETNTGHLYEWSLDQEKMQDQSKYVTEDLDAIQQSEKYLLGHNGAEVYIFDKRYRDPMYTISVLPGTDYITYDQDKRFDGTETARKRLYLTCGMEMIELDQVKDQLWVPGLAKRIMVDDNVNAVKISDLDICGLTPQVEKLEQKGGYRFRIIPQKGGLGETALYLNDIELRRYTPQQLLKTPQGYELVLTDAELLNYLKSGQDNKIDVKAYTAKNDISSRGVSVTNVSKPASPERPNLYAVMIGVSDYKGNELDLQYAAKDATDMSKAVAISARKLLNTDGKEHVFVYNLTSDASRYLLPEKKAIQQTLAAIGLKAKPNDILMIFFAGHGITHGPQKQFYLLSADASSATATGSISNVGISTAELTDWIQPSKIKAQKRILILDACNSGQAIKDLVQIGADQQNYLAARSSDNAEQIKAIDKLNERAGLFILAASASDQRAYEMGKFNQGILTYALLKSIKEQPDILDQGKYLDVGRWFGAAEKSVTDIVRETGNRQQPQVVSTSNFNIGVVDEEVMTSIKLPMEKSVFTASSLINPDAGDDDLGITQLINKHLSLISTRGEEGNIVYTMSTNSKESYMLTGIYTIKGDEILMKVNLKKGTEIKTRFEVKGEKNNLEKAATEAIKIASDWIAKNK
jgi:WD40 repeat protein/uncharacterized caspase-like protein